MRVRWDLNRQCCHRISAVPFPLRAERDFFSDPHSQFFPAFNASRNCNSRYLIYDMVWGLPRLSSTPMAFDNLFPSYFWVVLPSPPSIPSLVAFIVTSLTSTMANPSSPLVILISTVSSIIIVPVFIRLVASFPTSTPSRFSQPFY